MSDGAAGNRAYRSANQSARAAISGTTNRSA
jgi:hypothetical protein